MSSNILLFHKFVIPSNCGSLLSRVFVHRSLNSEMLVNGGILSVEADQYTPHISWFAIIIIYPTQRLSFQSIFFSI